MSDQFTSKPVVAIVGRPNVGKSSIFNRLACRRIAIVHAESGVTRDRLVCETTWGNHQFEMVDTGGIGNIDNATSQNEVDQSIRLQIDAALEDAAAVLFVVDLSEGLLPLDHEVAGILRSRGCPVFIAANKADGHERDDMANEFHELAFPVFPVSALHNRGFGDLMKELLKDLPKVDETISIEPTRVAVVGRPNVGKSSYINRLLRNNRVIVSDVPGTTRDSIDVPFTTGNGAAKRYYNLIDTAGMRRMGKVKSAVERYSHFRAVKSIKRADVVVLMLDASRGPSNQDKKIAAVMMKEGKGCVLLVTKWDLAKGVSQDEYRRALLKHMPFLEFAPISFLSSETGYNVRRTMDIIEHVATQVRMKIPTGFLNRVIADAIEERQPPAVKAKRLRTYYATQIGSQPIRIVLFVNLPRHIPPQYRTYLARALRHKIGLEGAPIFLSFRRRHKDLRSKQ